MFKLKLTLISLMAVGIMFGGIDLANADHGLGPMNDFCPTSVSGWWGTYSPTYQICDAIGNDAYYTWNTTSLGNEESWYKSSPHYQMCGYGTPPFGEDPGSVLSRAYIPSPNYDQTYSAHYYRWGLNDYAAIGTVSQYETFGWAYLATTDWDYDDAFKISDWTNEASLTHTVDLDAFGVTCHNQD